MRPGVTLAPAATAATSGGSMSKVTPTPTGRLCDSSTVYVLPLILIVSPTYSWSALVALTSVSCVAPTLWAPLVVKPPALSVRFAMRSSHLVSVSHIR